MSMDLSDRDRRCGDRKLVSVIYSADRDELPGLADYAILTRDWLSDRGFCVDDWPAREVIVTEGRRISGRRWEPEDDHGKRHVLWLFESAFGYDVLFGVSSRRTRNVQLQSGNRWSPLTWCSWV